MTILATPTSQDSAVLEVAGVHKAYGAARVLTDVSFQVDRGRVLGLLGPNGAGKTSLIRMVLDLIRPDAGGITLLGASPSPAARARVGYLPEERGLYPKQRVGEVLAYLVALAGVPEGDARRRAEGWLERVGLGHASRQKVQTLSKGMQQKVQLGAAVLHQPDLLILDEPFTGLDPVNRRLVAEVVHEAAARGAGVVVSTHLLDQAQRLCDDLVLLRGGRMLERGGVPQVRRRYAGAWLEVAVPDDTWEQPGVAAQVADCRPREGLWEVRLAEGATPGRLLAALVEADRVPTHFSQSLPSLEEVFVRAVEADGLAEAEAARAELAPGREADDGL